MPNCGFNGNPFFAAFTIPDWLNYLVAGGTLSISLLPIYARHLAADGLAVHALDLRGHGRSAGERAFAADLGEYVADLAIYVERVRASNPGAPLLLFGHSMGGAIATTYTLEHPVDGLILSAAALQLGPEVWMTREHLGRLAAFNGRAKDQPHPVLNRVVLSQKGPLLRYTEQNQLRAWLMQRVRRWLLAEDFQFRMPDSPTLRDELLDEALVDALLHQEARG